MKKWFLIFIILFVSAYAVTLKQGSPIREEHRGGSKLIALATSDTDFTIEKTYSIYTEVEVVEGSVKEGAKSSDHVGKTGWIYTPLLDGTAIGGEGSNLREKPTKNSDIVCAVKAGAKVKILKAPEDWVLVTNGDKELSGWTYGENLVE